MTEALLAVEDLSLSVATGPGRRRLLDRVSLSLRPGEVVGLVGESGSGKTLTALAIIGLLPRPVRVEGGRIRYNGADLLQLSEPRLRALRGGQIAMIFQNPRGSLNPLMRAGDQLARVVSLHQGIGGPAAKEMAIEMLRRVGIADPGARARSYPHQLSGGMAQRVLVAMMLACRPKVLIADEPTTGLDVTIQAQIFELIKDVQAETGAALLLISHDLGVVSETCQRVVVMYAGQVMELAGVQEIFAHPKHPYTEMLMDSLLRVDRPRTLEVSPSALPAHSPYDTAGCRFAGRCPHQREVCWGEPPPATTFGGGHRGYCYQYVREVWTNPS